MGSAKILIEMHEACVLHDSGPGHPERPSRLGAVERGIHDSGVEEACLRVSPRRATRREIEMVHSGTYLDAIEKFCNSGGGQIDPDTAVSSASWEAALVGAGGGLDAAERLLRGEAEAAFVAVRPPGHHATPRRAMGFCLINNVAVLAANLAEAGNRVLIVDFDAHHGNGTQDAFYGDGRVTYLSLHEWPLYPGTGWVDQTGQGLGAGETVNVPLPAGATGDVYLAAFDELVVPVAHQARPDWLVVSAGFDGHRADPLTGLALSAGDFSLLTSRLCELLPAGRRVVVLEGGYDLKALADSTAACLSALAGTKNLVEAPTSGGPGHDMVQVALEQRRRLA